MVSDALLDRDELSDDEWAVTPKPEHLVPDQITREREREEFRAELRDDPAAVVITHTDADGLSSAALIADYCGPDTVVQPIDYHGAYRFEHVVEDLQQMSSLATTDLFVCDFALDEPVDGLFQVGMGAREARWYDHHQWDDPTAEAVKDAGFELTIDEDECTASLLVDALPGADFDPYLEDLAECTKDIDLWIRKDPRSSRLNAFAAMVDDADDYVATVLECGADLPEDIEQRIDGRLERQRELEQEAIDRRVSTGIGGYTVAMTYIRGGRSNEIGNTLVEEHEDDYDIAVILKPHGGMGIYAHSDRETFARCHEVAAELGGGGHPTAAGCDVPVNAFRDLAEYWATAGQSVMLAVHEAIEAVIKGGGRDE